MMTSSAIWPQQPNCMPYEKFTDVLKKEYTEDLNFRGITEDGKVLMEVWVNKDSGSFTIIRVIMKEKHKLVCASIGGEAWHEAEDTIKKVKFDVDYIDYAIEIY